MGEGMVTPLPQECPLVGGEWMDALDRTSPATPDDTIQEVAPNAGA